MFEANEQGRRIWVLSDEDLEEVQVWRNDSDDNWCGDGFVNPGDVEFIRRLLDWEKKAIMASVGPNYSDEQLFNFGSVSSRNVLDYERLILSAYVNAPALLREGEYPARVVGEYLNTPVYKEFLIALLDAKEVTPDAIIGFIQREMEVPNPEKFFNRIRTLDRMDELLPDDVGGELKYAFSDLRHYSSSASMEKETIDFLLGYEIPYKEKNIAPF